MRNSILYYHSMSSPSRKARMVIFEKNIDSIEFKSVDIINGEQFEDWFLDLSPKGEVPVFVYYDEEDNETVITESTEIMKFIDSQYEPKNRLFSHTDEEKDLQKLLDFLGTYTLTWGVFSHCKDLQHLTRIIRYPYCNFIKYHSYVKRRMFTEKPKLLLKHSERKGPNHPSYNALKNKASQLIEYNTLFHSVSEFEKEIIHKVEGLLDRVEVILSNEDRIGPYLFGPVFSGMDISLSALLFRLHQLGLDEYFWGDGMRVNLLMYYGLIMKRSSVLRATEEERNSNNDYYLIASGEGYNWGYFGLMSVLCLAAFYIYKKLK